MTRPGNPAPTMGPGTVLTSTNEPKRNASFEPLSGEEIE
jgi:hypothetical protein